MIDETKFPEVSGGWYEIALLYDPDEVHDWFKRCMAEFPTLEKWGTPPYKGDEDDLIGVMLNWFDRWFSQFIEMDEIIPNLDPKQTCPQCGAMHFDNSYGGCCGPTCEAIMAQES